MTKPRYQVARKSVAVLDNLDENESQTANEIAEAVDMPLSTTYAYLSTLQELGLIDKYAEDYALGLNLLGYGIKSRQRNELSNHVRPYLPRIAEESGDCASFGVERLGHRLLVDIVEGEKAAYDNATVGERRPLHLTALGKAIMSQYEWDRIINIIERYDFEQHTDTTLSSTHEVRQEWDRTRSRGYAIENEEYSEHIRAVAVPIDPPFVAEVGAIGLSGPKHRFSADKIPKYTELLDKYAELIRIDIKHN